LVAFFVGYVGEIDAAVFHDVFFDSFSGCYVGAWGEEAAGKLLGEALFFVVWVADWHVEDSFCQTSIFAVRVRKDHLRHPLLEASGC
jgi:hypothetical protein